MTDKQFKFSLIVGGLLVALGAAITTQAGIGLGLLGVGVAIAVLAVFTRDIRQADEDSGLLPLSIEQTQQRASLDS